MNRRPDIPVRLRRTLRDTRRTPRRGASPVVIAAAALVLVALLAGGAWLLIKSNQLRVTTDLDTLCPTSQPVAALTVVLLDLSDRFSEPQLIDVQNRLARLRASLPRFGLIEVYTIERLSERVPKPLIHLCSPGTGADLNRLYQNPTLAKKRWDAFAARLQAEVTRLLTTLPSPVSPIYESIQATALRSFGRPEYDTVSKRLVIVSDLLQHMPGQHSHYTERPRLDTFRKTSYYAQTRADLEGVEIDLYYLNRSDLVLQGPDHIRFWEQYLAAQGGIPTSVDRIYGDR